MARLAVLTLLIALICSGGAGAAARNGGERRGALPRLDVEAGCRDIARNDLNKTTDYPGCIAEEQAAHDQLRKEWASYPGDMHDQCMHLVTPPALPSYITLQECLKMSRDARQMSKTDGATEIGKTMREPSKDRGGSAVAANKRRARRDSR